MKKTILLVNEDPAVRRMILRLLAGEGYNVIAAGVDRTSLETVTRNDVGLILLDSDVPDEHIREIIATLRSENGVPSVIILSNRADAAVVTGLRVSAVMEKPLDPEKLLGIIRDSLTDDPPPLSKGAEPSLTLVKPTASPEKYLH